MNALEIAWLVGIVLLFGASVFVARAARYLRAQRKALEAASLKLSRSQREVDELIERLRAAVE